ncbi:hypothetical protein D3C78_1693550 [compost metagenome]
MPMAAAASWAFSPVFQRMDAQPSGLITEYTEYCSISTWSATPMASAPPEPPSPMMVEMMGVCSCAIS